MCIYQWTFDISFAYHSSLTTKWLLPEAAAAAAAAFSTISWFEAAAAKSDNVCDAELLVRLKDPNNVETKRIMKKKFQVQTLRRFCTCHI